MEPVLYLKLLEKIQKEHRNVHIGRNNKRKIKYVTCNFDTRDGQIYRVALREWFKKDPESFPQYDNFDSPRLTSQEMYDQIVNWLDEEIY